MCECKPLLHGACRSGHHDMFLRLFHRAIQDNLGADILDRPNSALERPLHLAARCGSVDLVQWGLVDIARHVVQ